MDFYRILGFLKIKINFLEIFRLSKDIKIFEMKSISQIFKGNEHLMDLDPVEELIEYTQELEGQVMETKVNDSYNKEHILKSMLSDILSSCLEYEENKLLQERYPNQYEKIDSDSLVNSLMGYIVEMNNKNNLGL